MMWNTARARARARAWAKSIKIAIEIAITQNVRLHHKKLQNKKQIIKIAKIASFHSYLLAKNRIAHDASYHPC